MRTTTTLDDDLYALIERRAKETHRPFKTVLNEVLRRGVSALAAEVAKPARKVEIRPFAGMKFMPGVDPDRMNQISDELETEHVLEKMRREGSSR